MNFTKVVFYNVFHNGDIHLSRTFVKKLVDLFPNLDFTYAHKNNPNLLADIQRLKWMTFPNYLANKNYHTSFVDGDTLYLNTWYGAGKNLFNTYGITFDCLYYLFKEYFTHFGLDIKQVCPDAAELFPEINFDLFEINKAKFFLENDGRKKVYISNGDSLSGQAVNFNMAPMISVLAQNNPNVLFIVSNNQNDLPNVNNVILSSNIIKKDTSGDLNENAFVSSKCDMIIGRSSGTYTFAMVKDNLFKSKKIMLSFSTIGGSNNDYWLGPDSIHTIKYSSIVHNYNYTDWRRCLTLVQEHLNSIKGE